ncbi:MULTISPECIES: hypothetical protein [Flavobacterium]|uniref:Lipoprotein n=1 Tax=Flavobacterium keumense TaxID=1306518 RepID=A0ABY8N859_9FLAO|nr:MULTISPECIES: hypothetical protein [Flavobacterium]WGK95026.1 hypothetical protein MG292_02020 [Flavobacterium keumense]
MKKLRLLGSLLILFLTSCDPYRGAFIANSSEEKIIVNIKYNKQNEEIKSYKQIHNGFENFVNFIQEYNGSKGNLIAIDSTNFIATFELNQRDTLEIWGGIRQSNDFEEIEEVNIYPNKIKKTIKGEDIHNIFFERNQGFYIYTIK